MFQSVFPDGLQSWVAKPSKTIIHCGCDQFTDVGKSSASLRGQWTNAGSHIPSSPVITQSALAPPLVLPRNPAQSRQGSSQHSSRTNGPDACPRRPVRSQCVYIYIYRHVYLLIDWSIDLLIYLSFVFIYLLIYVLIYLLRYHGFLFVSVFIIQLY